MNIKIKIDDKENMLTITLPLEPKGTLSATKKSEIIASTRGNQQVVVNGEVISVGVNAYKKIR